MLISIPQPVETVLSRLHQNGFEAFLVGGCVRDSLRGAMPKDWDITTSAFPQQTLSAMQGLKVIETGLQHGTVTVISNGFPVEVTTYRVDGTYTDHRRPDRVSFTQNLTEDLKRRDFTINALAYSKTTGVIDCFGGREDLRQGVIRCVGNPDCRFSEDALRILRALRFASELCFSIHPDTAFAMIRKRELLQNIAVERICTELKRLLCGDNAGVVLQEYSTVLSEVLPEICDWPQVSSLIQGSPPDLPLRLAILLHGHSPESAKKILNRLRFDRRTFYTVSRLLQEETLSLPCSRPEGKRFLLYLGSTFSFKLLAFQRVLASDPKRVSIDAAEALMLDILQSGECWSLSMLAVNGKDLIQAGVSHGKAVGYCLNELLSLVIDGTLPNEKQALLSYAAKY